MSPGDAVVASRELPQWLLDFFTMDGLFAVLREKYEIYQHRISREQWKRDAVVNLPVYNTETMAAMHQYMTVLQAWEVDVDAGMFIPSNTVTTVEQKLVTLQEYRRQAGNFTSKAFSTLWN